MSHIFVLRATTNRENQVIDFITTNVKKKKLDVYSLIKAHGMRGYIFVEAENRETAEEAFLGVPYAKNLLPKELKYDEIKTMVEPIKVEVNIQENDIVEIITGPFKREKAKVMRIDQQKEEVIVELLESPVPIPITLKLDSIRVIIREDEKGK